MEGTNILTKEQYLAIFNRVSEYTPEQFFEWLEMFPDMMELSVTDIEVNFLFYRFTQIGYICGIFDHLGVIL
jgi:hypothetical protein